MPQFEDLTGRTFGRLKVLKRAENYYSPSGKQKTQYLCECDCDAHTQVVVQATHLKSGHTVSCGCVNKEALHRHIIELDKARAKHGLYESRLYTIYSKMLDRCYNPKADNYFLYGGRGIYVCDEWRDPINPRSINSDKFKNFYNWAVMNGYRDDLSIDRINGDGPYAPWNCRWATPIEQANNIFTNRMVNLNGIECTVTQAADALGVSRDRIMNLSRIGDYNLTSLARTVIDPQTGIQRTMYTDGYGNPVSVNAIYFVDQYGRPISQSDYQPPAPRPVCWKINDKGIVTGPCWIDDSDE